MTDIVGIIPARGGSKGVPGKNIKNLQGFPLMAYTIAVANKCNLLDKVIVSTDDKNIADIASSYGAEVPFLRPAEISTDKSSDLDFMLHAINWFKTNEGHVPSYFVHLRPTTPLRENRLIDQAIEAIKNNSNSTSLRSVHPLPEPPQKMFQIKNNFLQGFFPEDVRPEYYNLPRQTFPTAYHPNGYVDIISTKFVQQSNNKSLHGPNILAFITPVSVEVDSIEEFEYLEYIIQKNGHPAYDAIKNSG